ncbi:MAG: GFA family protein [Brevundimonas sp.]|nr:MAG: GFA family protein [Brevundimonas sp.]
MHACHCESCRRWSGGVYLSVECEDVVVEDAAALATFASSDWAERQFCRACGSSLFWRTRDGALTAVSIQAFDDPSAFSFVDEIFIDSKPSSYDFAGDRPRRTGEEVMAQFADEG